MTDVRILGVRAVNDLRDRLEWELRLHLPHYTEKGVDTVSLFDWEGDIAFYRDPLPPRSLGPTLNPNRMSLAVRWEAPVRDATNKCKSIECHPINTFCTTDVDTRILEQLEAFRSGRSLYARVEGRINLLYSSQVTRQFQDPSVSLREIIASESFELPLTQWSEEILPRLLPPGKFVVELDCSEELGGTASRDRVNRARRAYYDSRFDDMVAELYKVFEAVLPPAPVDEGDRLRRTLKNVYKGVKELLNLYRHHNPEVPPLTRPLARYLLLAVMQSEIFGTSHQGNSNAQG